MQTNRAKNEIIPLILLFLVIVGLAGGVIYLLRLSHDPIEEYEKIALSHVLDHRGAGRLESIHLAENKYLAAIYYPSFSDPSVDALIKGRIDPIVEQFIEESEAIEATERAILNIDYNSYQLNEQYASVYFEANLFLSTRANPIKIPQTLLLDLTNGKEVQPTEVFYEAIKRSCLG